MTKKNAKLTMKDLEDAGIYDADLEYLEELNDRGARKEDLGIKRVEDDEEYDEEEYGPRMSIYDLPPEVIDKLSNPTIKGIKGIELIAILESFETPELKVEISNDAGVSHTPISIVLNNKGAIGFCYYGFKYSADAFIPEFINRGKMVSGLIEEIYSFENLQLLVKVCTRGNDDGVSTYQLINRVIKKEDVIVLTYDETLEK